MPNHPVIRLRAHAGRRVLAGAPWAFSNEVAIDAAAKALPAGSLVRLARPDGTVMGTGYFNPHSLIAVRLLTRRDAEIDEGFFFDRIKAALALRERLFPAPFYRLAHAEGDGLPGVSIDRFASTVVVQVTTAGAERLTSLILGALDSIVAPEAVLLKNDAVSRALEGLPSEVRPSKGAFDAPLPVEENGVRYFADPAGGQKTGWYYDQRDNRAFMASLAKGVRVLDAYCYTGGFALAGAHSSAAETLGIDTSSAALELAVAAAAANGVTCAFRKADAFDEMERLASAGERFGIVICDPPPFVRARKDLESGARAYRKLARLAAALVGKGGFLMLASCSHNMPAERLQEECAAGIARANRAAALVRHAGAGPDHPVHPMLPETAYLKTLVYALD